MVRILLTKSIKFLWIMLNSLIFIAVDDISLELDSRVSEITIYDNYVEIDLDY